MIWTGDEWNMERWIITVTLNPALDKTITISQLNVGGLNRAKSVRIDPGGKGINVAKVLNNLGEKVEAAGLIAGSQGKLLLDFLKDSGIKTNFHVVDGETRTNMKVVEDNKGIVTEINEPGFTVSEKDLQHFERKLSQALENASLLILSGSIPSGINDDIYSRFIKAAKSKEVRTILDAEGKVLKNGIEAVPYAVKPNVFELELLMNRKMQTVTDILDASRLLTEQGIELVAVSMGAGGAIVSDKTCSYHVLPYPITPRSTVGAGDSMVAAFAYTTLKKYSLEEAAKWAAAAGTVTATKPGTEVCTLEEVTELVPHIQVKNLKLKK